MGEQDRRTAPRHTPSCNRIWTAWMEEGKVRRAEVCLDDLSSSGAAILIDEPLPTRGPLWIGLEGFSGSEGVIADVVRVVPQKEGTWRVGLRFARPCALKFFRKAIWGLEPAVPHESQLPPSRRSAPRFPVESRSQFGFAHSGDGALAVTARPGVDQGSGDHRPA